MFWSEGLIGAEVIGQDVALDLGHDHEEVAAVVRSAFTRVRPGAGAI
jgi:hypothetical protein